MKSFKTRDNLFKTSPDPKRCIIEIVKIQLKVYITRHGPSSSLILFCSDST
jgi:hypothetical protein